MTESFKIWCETNEIRDKVLAKLEEQGAKWVSGHYPTKYNMIFDAPMYLDISCNEIKQGTNELNFKINMNKEIKAKDFLKQNETIIIYRNGKEVIALDKSTGEKAVAKCHPEDEFDFKKGAKLALERLTQKPKVTFRALCVKDYYCLGYLAWEKGKVYEWIDGECTREDGMISSNYNSFSELIRCNTSYKDYFVELKDGDNPAEILKKYDEIKIGDMVTVVDYGCGYSTYKDWSGLGKYEQNFVYDKSISNGGKYKVLNIKKHDTFKDMIALVQDPETTQVFMIGIEGIKKIE